MNQENNNIWYNPQTDSIGFGKSYGEYSFNNKPVNSIKVDLKELKGDFNPNNPQRKAIENAKARTINTSK